MIANVTATIPFGYEGRIVEVEGDSRTGLPGFNIVGMASKTVTEATERVKSAIKNSGLKFPTDKITVNLAPAELVKSGSCLDLAIAVSVLIISGQLRQKAAEGRVFIGELSLDGHLRPVRGIINIVEAAKEAGYREVFLPEENYAQARLVEGIDIFPVRTLMDLMQHLLHQKRLKAPEEGAPGATRFPLRRSGTSVVKITKTEVEGPEIGQIRGQELAKRALAVAIAGHHNILISGSPGAGKTLLAKAARNLMPELTPEEQISITKLYSLTGVTNEIISIRPFRAPHHTSSLTSLVGGGTNAKPGEISLAHLGVLFLDELPEYPRSNLEALRQPLEDRKITISRANDKYTYPADFMLIATMNPCPCGFLGDKKHKCTCTPNEIRQYQRKLSGPLLDRIDLKVEVDRVKNEDLLNTTPVNAEQKTSSVREAIERAISAQHARYGDSLTYNSTISSGQIAKMIELSKQVRELLGTACEKLDLSARAYFKIIKVTRTIADLEGAEEIQAEHLMEALNYR